MWLDSSVVRVRGLRGVLGSSPGRVMCFFLPCDRGLDGTISISIYWPDLFMISYICDLIFNDLAHKKLLKYADFCEVVIKG